MSAPIQPIPTHADIEAAHRAKLDAWLAWVVSDDGTQEWADYMAAIELHADLQFRRQQAILKGAEICSI